MLQFRVTADIGRGGFRFFMAFPVFLQMTLEVLIAASWFPLNAGGPKSPLGWLYTGVFIDIA